MRADARLSSGAAGGTGRAVGGASRELGVDEVLLPQHVPEGLEVEQAEPQRAAGATRRSRLTTENAGARGAAEHALRSGSFDSRSGSRGGGRQLAS